MKAKWITIYREYEEIISFVGAVYEEGDYDILLVITSRDKMSEIGTWRIKLK